MDPLMQEIEEIYTLLTEATKTKNSDYSKAEQKRIQQLTYGVDTNQIKAFAQTKGVNLPEGWKRTLLIPLAKACTKEEFTSFLSACIKRSRKSSRTSSFESLGKIKEVSNWTVIRAALQTEFRKCSQFTRLPENKKVTVIEKSRILEGYAEYTFRFPVSATVKEWKNDDLPFDKPDSVKFRIMTTGELLVKPSSRTKEHYPIVWEIMKRVLGAKEVPVNAEKKEEAKQQVLGCQIETTEAKFVHVEKDKKFKLSIEGDGALAYLKEILGDKYQAFSEAFDLVSGVEKDGRKRTFT